MSTEFRKQSENPQTQGPGGVWYLLRAEREEICQALVSGDQRFRGTSNLKKSRAVDNLAVERELQARLQLIDSALDRLMSGSYGECVKCGRWIEDSKLNQDPAFAYCVACEHGELWPLYMRAHVTGIEH